MKKVTTMIVMMLLAGFAFAGQVADISVEDLAKEIEAGSVTVIDVNGSKSFSNGRVPGAIDFQTEAKNLKNLLPEDKDSLIVAYCSGPRCGAYKRATMAAEKLGYTNIKHMSAGISGWRSAGQELEKN